MYSPNHFQKIGGFVVLLQAPNLFTQKVSCLKNLNHFLVWFSVVIWKDPGVGVGGPPQVMQKIPALSGQGYSCEEIELTELLPKARSSISGHSSSGYFFWGGVSFCGVFFGITRFFRKEVENFTKIWRKTWPILAIFHFFDGKKSITCESS